MQGLGYSAITNQTAHTSGHSNIYGNLQKSIPAASAGQDIFLAAGRTCPPGSESSNQIEIISDQRLAVGGLEYTASSQVLRFRVAA